MGLFSNLFGKKAIIEPLDDPILGTLVLGDTPSTWVSHAVPNFRPFAIEIGGPTTPDSALLVHARDIHGNSGTFTTSVYEFLGNEKKKFPPDTADEIASLQIEMVGLWWPKRPNDGMIFFEGGDEGRVWRCDYINRTPANLGFDS